MKKFIIISLFLFSVLFSAASKEVYDQCGEQRMQCEEVCLNLHGDDGHMTDYYANEMPYLECLLMGGCYDTYYECLGAPQSCYDHYYGCKDVCDCINPDKESNEGHASWILCVDYCATAFRECEMDYPVWSHYTEDDLYLCEETDNGGSTYDDNEYDDYEYDSGCGSAFVLLILVAGLMYVKSS